MLLAAIATIERLLELLLLVPAALVALRTAVVLQLVLLRIAVVALVVVEPAL